MQLIVDIQNESLADKIKTILSAFKDDGIVVKEIKNSKNGIAWKELGMNTHSADLDDDERLYEACAEFYNEKYSN